MNDKSKKSRYVLGNLFGELAVGLGKASLISLVFCIGSFCALDIKERRERNKRYNNNK